jgi:hypothetical protein
MKQLFVIIYNYNMILYNMNTGLKIMNKSSGCYDVLNSYSGKSKYKYINQFLLMDEDENKFTKRFKKDMNEIKNDVKGIDVCFGKAPITQNDKMVVYRGMDKDIGLKIGESMVLKNYTSTSMNLGRAREFVKIEYDKKTVKRTGECCLYRLHIGEGIPYIIMDNFSKFGAMESEILLPRNLVMTYISDELTTVKDYWYMNPKTVIRNMKITKLNDNIKPNVVVDMGEPLPQEIIAEGIQNDVNNKEDSPKKIVEEDKKKRCPKGTKKNKQGICVKTGSSTASLLRPASIPMQKHDSEEVTFKDSNKKCPEGTVRKLQFVCETIPNKNVEVILKYLHDKKKSPELEKIKRCPKGTRKNKQGTCVKTVL